MTNPHEQPQHPQPSKEGWEKSLEPYVLKWESEGRTEEQKWAVRNFLSGAGATGIQSLLKEERHKWFISWDIASDGKEWCVLVGSKNEDGVIEILAELNKDSDDGGSFTLGSLTHNTTQE